jgi:hypothetical protein
MFQNEVRYTCIRYLEGHTTCDPRPRDVDRVQLYSFTVVIVSKHDDSFHGRLSVSCFHHCCVQKALGPTCVPGSKGPEHEADHSPTTEV